MQKTITKRAVGALKPGEIIVDDQLPGFVCRRLPSGRLTFGYRFTHDGKRQWLGIGVGIAPEAARKAATLHAGAVAKDHNPVIERAARRQKALAARTVSDILDGFIKARVKGTITINFIVGSDGRIQSPTIVKGLDKGLNEQSLQILSMYRYEPAEQNGRHVATKGNVSFGFYIQ
jgi:hypothetical protein